MAAHGSEVSVATGRLPALLTGLAAFAAVSAFFFAHEAPWTLRGDNMVALFPLELAAWQSWLAGHVPDWSGGLWAGFPLLSDPTSGSLYWPNLLCFALTPSPHLRAFDLATALHAALLVAGSVRLLQALGVAPAAAVFGGLVTLAAPTQQWFASAILHSYSPFAWWPWLWLAAERLAHPTTRVRSGAMLLGWLALATQGLWYPEFALYSGLVAGAWLLTRNVGLPPGRRLARAALLGLGGLALAAPQIVPTAFYLASTDRGAALPLGEAALVAFRGPLSSLLAGDPSEAGMPQFLGVGALLLAAAAVATRRPRAIFLAVLAALGLVLALGLRTPVYGWLHTLPPFDKFRSPMKLFMLTEFAVAWLAALGADALLHRRGRAGRAVAALLMLLALGERAFFDQRRLLDEERLPGGRERSFTSYREQLHASGLLEHARAEPGQPPPRVLETVGLRDLVMLDGLEQLTGGPTPLRDRYQRELIQAGAWTKMRLRRRDLDLWGVHFLLTGPSDCEWRAENEQISLLRKTEDTCLFENPSRPPRYRFATLAHSMPTWDSMVSFIKVDPAGPVPMLRPDEPPERRLPFAPGSIEAVSYRPGDVRLRVRSEGPGPALLYALESYARGWQARVDGEPATIHPAAGVFFALPVPVGAHEVHLRYRTPGLGVGVAIAAGWLAAVAAGAIALRRRPRL